MVNPLIAARNDRNVRAGPSPIRCKHQEYVSATMSMDVDQRTFGPSKRATACACQRSRRLINAIKMPLSRATDGVKVTRGRTRPCRPIRCRPRFLHGCRQTPSRASCSVRAPLTLRGFAGIAPPEKFLCGARSALRVLRDARPLISAFGSSSQSSVIANGAQ